MCGLFGHGDAFALRDPNAIRPAYYYKDDEIVVVASERPVIQTSFNVNIEDVKEIKAGHALIIKKQGFKKAYLSDSFSNLVEILSHIQTDKDSVLLIQGAGSISDFSHKILELKE